MSDLAMHAAFTPILADRRRTILYTGGFELPDRNAAAQRVLANAAILRDLGYRVLLLGVRRQGGPDGGLRRAAHPGLGFEAWDTPYPASAAAWFSQVVSIRPIVETLDDAGVDDLAAIILYNHPAVAQVRALRLAHARGAACIADVTEWYDRVQGGGIAGLAKNIDVPLRMRLVNRRMDGLITTSPFLSDYYRSPGKPIVELPTLMAEDANAPAPISPTVAGGPKRLFFAGSGFDPKRVGRSGEGLKDRIDLVIALLAEAARMGADFRFDAFGLDRDTYLQLRPDHRAIVAELGDRIAFHGFQPRHMVLACLARADFSIFLRDRTRVTLAGFPTKYAESVHYGTPVLTNPMPNLARYHVDGRTGFLIDAGAGRRLSEILALPQPEVRAMKAFCAGSRIFDHHSFHEPVAAFMAELTAR